MSEQSQPRTPGEPAREKVVAVVVTYNRRQLLEKTLAGLAQASTTPEAIVVVDNASDDGTAAYLSQWAAHSEIPAEVLTLGANTGGAGGFAVGMDRALVRHGAHWVWIMDDDTEPQPETLSQALAGAQRFAAVAGQQPSFIASEVFWTDGRPHPMNRTKERLGLDRTSRDLAREAGVSNIRTASFVSIFISAASIREHGLPLADYFIWNDDFEYTARLSRRVPAIAVPGSTALHHTKVFGDAQADPGERFYYEVRNKLWVYSRSGSLSWWERVLFTGASVRNWTRTIARSSRKDVLLAGLRRAVLDARSGPRPNRDVLAGIYELQSPGQR